jgi:hypothetical protein
MSRRKQEEIAEVIAELKASAKAQH